MPSVVEICNLALSHIAVEDIQSLDDNIRSARQCKLKYPNARNSVLSDFPWNFARKRQVLALLTETYSGWEYAYTYPTDCLRAQKIYDPTGSDNVKIEFEIAVNDDKTGRIILTDQEQAELIFTARVEDPNVFEPAFVDALTLRLASDLCYTLKGDRTLQQQLLQMYFRQLGLAQASNANEGRKPDNRDSVYVTARR